MPAHFIEGTEVGLQCAVVDGTFGTGLHQYPLTSQQRRTGTLVIGAVQGKHHTLHTHQLILVLQVYACCSLALRDACTCTPVGFFQRTEGGNLLVQAFYFLILGTDGGGMVALGLLQGFQLGVGVGQLQGGLGQQAFHHRQRGGILHSLALFVFEAMLQSLCKGNQKVVGKSHGFQLGSILGIENLLLVFVRLPFLQSQNAQDGRNEHLHVSEFSHKRLV